ncbi:hypothetical protein SCALM49S_00894 [Streptomyces californicus]
MREDAVLQAGEEDDGELQALRRVQRHQRDDPGAVLLLVGDLVGVRDEGDLLQELGEGARTLFVAALLLELQGDGGEFLEVLDPGLVLRVVGRLELGEVARTLQHGFQYDGGPGAGLDDRAQLLHQRVEALDRVGRAGGHAVRLVDAARACGKEIFSRIERASIMASARSPMPRLGTLRMRRSGTVSSGLARTRR